uniref:T9SS type A sorting domain-containing protein n=1 Tax=uncultured Draconibacterium sp. TaxID=1573823 RepID=UPI003216CAE0
MKRNFTLLVFLVAICSMANAQRLIPQWSRSVGSDALPNWFGNYTERGIAADNQYVYVATRNNEAKMGIKCMDAKTGADIGDLSVNGVAEGGYLLNDVEVSDDGQILACNLGLYHEQWVPDGSWTFKIYKWTDKDAEPEVFIEFDNPNERRLGDLFTVKGDLTKNAVIYAPVTKSTEIYRWEVVNGVLNETPEVLNLPELANNRENATPPGQFPKIMPCGVTKNDPFIYNALGVFPAKYSADATTKLGQLSNDNYISSNGLVSADECSGITFDYEEKTYFASLSILTGGDNNNSEAKAVDITNGLTEAKKPFYSETLGIAPNIQRNGDIAYTTIDGEVYVYILYSNAGFAAFKFNSTPVIDVPVTETGWRRAIKDTIDGMPTIPAWCDDMARTMAYGNGHLYVARCAENNVPGEIIILDAKDGSTLDKKLNVEALNEANFIDHANTIRISDVEVDDAGHILACNVRLKEKPFTIFAWDDEDSEPYKLLEVMPPYGDEDGGAAWQQTAFYMDVKGDIKGDAVIVAGRSNYGSVYKWVIKDGVLQNEGNPYVTLYTVPGVAQPGPYVSACIESDSADANIWVDGDNLTPTCIDKDGNHITSMPADISTSGGDNRSRTAVKCVNFKDKKFILEWNWNWADHTRLIDINGDIESWEGAEWQEVGTYMGQVASTYFLGDVDYQVDGDYINIYTLSPNNGIKMDRIFMEPEEVVVPVTEDGWRRAILDTIDGESTKPYWLDQDSRAVAAGNGHIYVVNCAPGNHPGEILILDAKDGSKLDKKLKVNPVNSNNDLASANHLRISDVEVDDAGHILASNMRVEGIPFAIFAWDDEDSDPYKLVEVTPPYDIEDPGMTWHQTAYYFDVKGDIKGNAVIIAARSNNTSTYKWVIQDGVIQNDGNPYVMIHELPEGGHWGAYGSACIESADPNTNIWVDGSTIDPICYDNEGSILYVMPEEVSTRPDAPHYTSVKFLTYAKKNYILEWNWAYADHTRLIDVSGDMMEITEENVMEMGSYLGQAPNDLKWGDVDYFIENDTLNIVTLSTNNGIKVDKFYSVPTAAKIVSENKELSVYPNPVENVLTVSHPAGCKKVEFVNILGATVKEVVNLTNKPINVSDLGRGVYFVRVTPNDGEVEVRKIIKH